jgi:hypothetical protein
LWVSTGGEGQQIPTPTTKIFTDSMNWSLADGFWAAVYDGQYVLSCAFGAAATKNNRLLVLDLESHDISFITGFNPGAVFTWYEPGYGERLFVGDADSSVIYEFDKTSDVYRMSDYRTGFETFGDPSRRHLVREYLLTYESDNGDSIGLDFYAATDAGAWPTTATWTDWVVASATGTKSVLGGVSRLAQGRAIALGFRSDASAVRIIEYEVDVADLGKERPQ